jgi:hypothetical protein
VKALTLHQPWASLIFHGRKTVETRSWGTSYRGLLAIHAAKTVDIGAAQDARVLYGPRYELGAIPRGCIVGICELYDVVRMTPDWLESFRRNPLNKDDLRWGNFDEGRYAWMLANFHAAKPEQLRIPVVGARGLWDWVPCDPAASAVKGSNR